MTSSPAYIEYLEFYAQEAFDLDKSPFFVTSNHTDAVVSEMIDFSFPRFLVTSGLSGHIGENFIPNYHNGLVFEAMCVYDWPQIIPLGPFYNLLTGQYWEGLPSQHHHHVPQIRRIFTGMITPEKLFNQWRIAFVPVLGPLEDEMLRNVFRDAYARIHPIYVNVEQNQQEQAEFQQWLYPNPA